MRPALACWLVAASLGHAATAGAAEQAKVVLTWPGGAPQVVQFWDGGVHVRDEHRDRDGHKRQEARYDGAVVRWQQFRDDGSVQAQWQTAAGRREGEEQWLDPQGRLVRSIPWRNGKRNGLIREFDAQGHLQSEVPYADDAAVGPQVGYYPTGERRSVAPLLDGVRHGTEVLYDREGWKYAEMPYWHGVLDGKVLFFAKEGWRRGEIHYSKGQTQGPEVQFHRNGKRAMVVPLRPDGMRQGEAELFDEAGVRVAVQPYVAGKLQGWDRRWDAFGRLQAEVEWREGDPCCGERSFWPSGALRAERVYVDLAQDGTETDYFDRDTEAGTDHRVELQVALVRGRKSGRALVYDRQGRRWSELTFVDDRREGPEVRYYPTGEKQGEFQWKSDRLTGLATTYWPSGKLQSRYPADDGAGTGLEQRWNENGVLLMEVPLVQGKKHGVARLYNERGKLRATMTWRDDVLDGPEVRYHKGKPLGTWQWRNGELVSGPPPAAVAAAEEEPEEAVAKPSAGAVPGANDARSDARKVRRAAHKVQRDRSESPDVARSYWPSGELRSALPKRGKGTEVQFHDNGEVAVVAAVDQGIRQGLARTFDRSGRLIAQVSYVDGLRDGEEVEYGAEGERLASRRWQRGKPVGVTRTWYPGGGLQSERHADPNLPSGSEVQYYRSGGVRVYAPLRFGKRDGIATVYTEAGVKWAEVSWREGHKHGEERRYDARGALIERLWWQADQSAPAPGAAEPRPAAKEHR
ncbi:MAG: hypothetical protein HY902_07920 [Deltaproteobacteria bacterium]|nr:hypothetical protein [Deltaproteobacteria bacterium]